MVGRFTLPSLPSLPQSMLDFLDPSPAVFYPPSRPSSRGGAGTASCPSSPSPRRKPRPLSMGDARILFAQPSPLPPFNPTAHPHTDSPLEASTRGDRDKSPSEPSSPQLGTSTRGQRPRPQHRRSHSAAPTPSTCGLFGPMPLPPTRALGDLRNPLSSASAASLPTLAEDTEPRRPTPSSPLIPTDRQVIEPGVKRTLTLPRGRRGAYPSLASSTSSMSMASVTITTSESSYDLPVASQSSTLGAPRRARTTVRRESTHNVAFPKPLSPRRGAVPSSTSVSDFAVLATWSEDAVAVPPRGLSRSQSVTSPSNRLRERLRSLTALETGIPTPRKTASPRPGFDSPATPRSTHGTPGHGTPQRPGSSTPTSRNDIIVPTSPTPTRHRAPRAHTHTHSLPEAMCLAPDSRLGMSTMSNTGHGRSSQTARPTTSRLRQPAQLSLASEMPPPSQPSWSRRSSLLAPVSPLLPSSPGSLMSDHGSSPSNSVESFMLGPPFALRERDENIVPLDCVPPPVPPKERRFSDARTSRDFCEFGDRTTLLSNQNILNSSTSTIRSRRSQSLRDSTRSLRESTRSTHSIRRDSRLEYRPSIRERRDSLANDVIHHPTHGTRVVISVYDNEEDRFLDFDDI